MRTRRLHILPRLLAIAALTVLVPASPGAAAGRDTARSEARRLLAPMQQFERSTRSLRPAVEQALAEWTRPVKSCLATVATDLVSAPGAELHAEARGEILTYMLMSDGLDHVFAPVSVQLKAAEARWHRLKLRTPALRALARDQVRSVHRLLNLASVDTCAFYGTWRQSGLTTRVPDSVRAFEDQLAFTDGGHMRHMELLRDLVSQSQADRFELFPGGLVTTDDLLTPLAPLGFPEEVAQLLDSNAKQDARTLVGEVELCYAHREDYRRCNSAAELRAGLGSLGLRYGRGPGEAAVVRAAKNSYVVESVSAHNLRNVFERFRVTRSSRGLKRACRPVGHGGCSSKGRW